MLLLPKHLQTSIGPVQASRSLIRGLLMDHGSRIGIRLNSSARQAVSRVLSCLVLYACMIQTSTLSRSKHPAHTEKEAVLQLTHL